ncbi:MAG: signal peptidase II [Rickettsiales bacterium]|jgi:signal peptidase II|nr:signal peptidase II [Rickettsiales bacterium]
MKRKWILPILIMLLVIVIDQLSKGGLLYLITGRAPMGGAAFSLVPYPYMMTQVSDFFNVVFTWNPGTSFSMLRGIGESMPLVIIALTGIIIGVLVYQMFFGNGNKTEKIGMAMIVGGALGNLIDRVRFGAVIDFLDFHIGAWHWPAFNFADMAICFGVVMMVVSWLISAVRDKTK